MKILKKLCLLIPIFLIFILSSCSPDVYELDLENFDTTITYKDEVDINNIKIKNVSKDEVISLTNEMFTVPIKTDQVGDFEAKISYESLNFDLSYSVRYQITFDILGEKTISHVLSKDDLTIPEVSDTNDKVFSHFEPEIPEIINDNYEFMAIFKDKVNELPELASSYSVSYLDSTNDIKLPENSFGKWEFESETVFKEIKEYELNVIFHPFDQKYEEVHEKVIVNVKKRKFEFNNLVTEFTYDGKPHKVTYDNKDNVNVLELNNKEEINVGSYDYEIIVKDDFYQGSISGKFIIKKAKLNIILPTITKEYTNGFSLTIDDIVNHKDFKILGNYVSLEDLKLSLVTKVTSAGKHIYEVKSNSTNYDCTFTKGEAIIDKGNINIDSLPTISSAAYLDKLGDLTLINNTFDMGAFTYKDPEIIIDKVGTYKVTLVFVPNDSNNYNTFEKEIEITVSKKILSLNDYLINDTFTYDAKEHSLIFDFKEYSNLITLDGNTGEIEAGIHEKNIRINSECFEGQLTAFLKINKARPTFNIPEIEAKYNQKLGDIKLEVLDNGQITFDNKEFVLNVIGNVKVNATFTPDDKQNYETVKFELTINVLKLESVITASNQESIFNNKEYSVIYELNNKEQTLEFIYKLNGKVVNNIFNAGSYSVTIKAKESEHYLASKITITVKINKADYVLQEIEVVATYGMRLSEIKLPENKEGKIVFNNPNDLVGNVGGNKHKAKFIPNDSNYNTKTINIIINVTKLRLEFNIINHTYTYDSLPHKVEYSLSVEDLNVTGNTEHTKAGSYDITLRIDESNYEGSITTTLTILKADPEFISPVVSANYNQKLSEITLEKLANGVITFDNLNHILNEIGNVFVDATFTPNDQENYNIIYFKLTINVLKLESVITASNQEVTFNNQVYKVVANINNQEQTLEFTYTLNGKVVPEIKEVGTYNVVIVAKESAHYNEARKEIIVTVNPKQAIDPDKEINAVYGTKLSEINFDEVEGGRWTWVRSDDYVGEVGRRLHQAKFIPSSTSYEEKIVDVTIIVSKKVLKFNITKDTFTYDGKSHKLEYTLPVESLNVTGNTLYTNAGTFKVTLTIEETNYEGTITHNLIINKAKPIFEALKENYEVTIDDSINVLTEMFPKYDNGSINVDSLPQIFSEANSRNYKVVFVPSDTNNYQNVDINIRVTVLRKVANISGNDTITLDYTSQVIDLNQYYSLNHTDTKLVFSYNLNDSVVNNILNAGTYKVTIRASETAKYSSVSRTVTVVINKIAFKPQSIILNATYGDLLSSLKYETSDYYVKFANPSLTVGDAGQHNLEVILVSKNDNYLDTKATITINVSKKHVNINVTRNEFTYDSNPHSIEYELDVKGLKVTGNSEYIDASTYQITLTIDEKNYEGQLDTELIILPKEITGITVSDGTNTYDFNQNLKIEFDKTETAHKLDIKLNNEKLPEFVLLNVNNENVAEVSLKENGKYVIKLVVNNKNYKEITHIIEVYIYVAMSSESTNYQNPTKYVTVGEALEATKNAQTQTYLYLFASDTLDDKLNTTYEIGKNVILYIPHELRDAYTAYTKDSDLGPKKTPNHISSTPKLFTNLTINQNITVIVNGKIEIGANRGQAQPLVNLISTAYSQITLNGKLLVNGTIWIAGKIIGDGEITLNANSTLYEPFSLVDWRGGTNANGVYHINDPVAPFSNYRLRNNECRTIINYGSNYTGYASIHAAKSWHSADYKFIGTGAILEVKDSNSKVIKYLDKTDILEIPDKNKAGEVINAEYNGIYKPKKIEKMVFELYGNIQDNAGALKVGSISLNTGKVLFPIGYSSRLVIKSGTIFTVTQKYKMLPGSVVEIEADAKVNLKGQLVIYNEWNDKGYGSTGTMYYPHELSRAQLINNGTINSTGIINGIINSTKNDSNIIIGANGSVTSYEGYADGLSFFPKWHETDRQTLALSDANGNIFDPNSTYIYDGTKWNKQ